MPELAANLSIGTPEIILDAPKDFTPDAGTLEVDSNPTTREGNDPMPDPTPTPSSFERVAEIQFQVIREIADKLDQRIGRLESRLTLILVLIASNVLGISLENAKAVLSHLGA